MGLGSAEHDKPTVVPVLRGDFDAFVRRERDGLVRFLHRRTGSEDDAQDIAQESLTRLMRYREQAPDGWASLLYRIAINALNDRKRRAHSHYDAQHVSLDVEVTELVSTEPTHEQRTATEQELMALQRALLRLPERCRQVYLLNRIEGMTYTEIATHCGISIKAVEKHISRALRLLRERLGAPDTETRTP